MADDVVYVDQYRDLESAGLTEDALALIFAELHKDDLRYVAEWNRWFRFDAIRWQQDRVKHAFDLVRLFLRNVAGDNQGKQKLLTQAKKVGAVHMLAQSDKRLATTTDVWDRNPDILNGSNGRTIELLTAEMRPPTPADYCTKIAGAGCDKWIATPIWDGFIDRITGGDKDLRSYLKRVAGYCLTGHTREHVLFFLYGTGANGKSVFVNTLSAVFGDYSATAPMELFMKTYNEQHPTGLAHLQGARLVIATETDSDGQWSEAKIKRLTGGDKIAARYMRGDFFEFTPRFKIMIAGNHAPALTNVDEAFRRRLHLIPFTITIPEAERDDELFEKLKAEWTGILTWAIDGAADWYETGLRPPSCVLAATADYLENEDRLGQWMAENLEPSPAQWQFETTNDLYDNFRKWCQSAGEDPPNMKRFAMTLRERGFVPDRDPNARSRRKGFKGIRLIREDYSGEKKDSELDL